MNFSVPTYLFVLPWALEHAGGVNQVVINLARVLQKSGLFDPLVLICDWAATEPIFGESHGLRTVRWRVRPWQPNMSLKEKISYWLWENRFRSSFQRFCIDNNVGVINSHYPSASVFSIERAVKNIPFRPRLIISFHGTDVNSHKESNSQIKAEWRSFLLRVDRVVACSRDLGQKIREVFAVEISPAIIHNGIDSEGFTTKAGKSMSLPRDRRVILNIGKFDDVKGQDVLIKAFALLSKDYTDVDLVLIGASGKALHRLINLCANEGIQERVTFHQDMPHDRIPDFFKLATLFVLPSRREAFPIVILEAGAFGLPVIASAVGGIPEILKEGNTGWLVPPDTPTHLANSIRSVLENPVGAKKIGEALRDVVTTSFTWTSASEKYLNLIVSRHLTG